MPDSDCAQTAASSDRVVSELIEHPTGGAGDLGDGGVEGGGVAARRGAVAADLAHELQGGGLDLGVVDGAIGVAQGLDAAAHGGPPNLRA